MVKKREKTEASIENDQRILRGLPRCRVCGGLLIATSDTTKKSELTEFMGMGWMKTKPQFMYMYPTAKQQKDLCFYHRQEK